MKQRPIKLQHSQAQADDVVISDINHITLAVTEIDRSFLFYRDVLGFQPLCKWPEGAYFLVGELWFCLSKDATRDTEASRDYTHVAFTVSQTDFPKMVARLKKAGAGSFKKNVSEGDSFYFRDPDGHKLELHVGDWRSRIAAKKKNPWQDTEFFV